METISHFKGIIICLSAFIIYACSDVASKKNIPQIHKKFDANTLIVKENDNIRKICGQVLYLPIYSNIPYFEGSRRFDLSAFVAIHNTDLNRSLKITKVLFFDNDGMLVSDYLRKDSVLQPLGSTNFFVPEEDKSGIGANFIVEWVSDSLINEPLVESVMIGLSGGQGISFSSVGRIMRESK
jgi:hypothetical protein